MNVANNGKTQKNSSRYNNSIPSYISEGLAGTEATSEVNGICNQDGYDNRYSPGTGCSAKFDESDSAVGKILTRLKELESGYECLFSEQEEKLQTQLKEVREKAAKLKESGREIEKDIQQLMSGEQ